MKKRFQECNLFIKTWRCRWYLLLPFKYIRLRYYNKLNNKLAYTIAVGEIQINMNWTYTNEEVFDHIEKTFK